MTEASAAFEELVRRVAREEVERHLAARAPAASVPPAHESNYISTKEVAELTGYAVVTLEQMRARGEGPPFERRAPRARVRYPRAGVLEWMKGSKGASAP